MCDAIVRVLIETDYLYLITGAFVFGCLIGWIFRTNWRPK